MPAGGKTVEGCKLRPCSSRNVRNIWDKDNVTEKLDGDKRTDRRGRMYAEMYVAQIGPIEV